MHKHTWLIKLILILTLHVKKSISQSAYWSQQHVKCLVIQTETSIFCDRGGHKLNLITLWRPGSNPPSLSSDVFFTVTHTHTCPHNLLQFPGPFKCWRGHSCGLVGPCAQCQLSYSFSLNPPHPSTTPNTHTQPHPTPFSSGLLLLSPDLSWPPTLPRTHHVQIPVCLSRLQYHKSSQVTPLYFQNISLKRSLQITSDVYTDTFPSLTLHPSSCLARPLL